jgi:hypothetical protein
MDARKPALAVFYFKIIGTLRVERVLSITFEQTLGKTQRGFNLFEEWASF